MKVVVIAADTDSLVRFRGNLIKDIIAAGHEVVTLAPQEGYEAQIEALGATFIKLDIERTGCNPIRDVKSIVVIKKLVKRINPDVVFSYTIKPVIYGSLGAKLAGVGNIYSMLPGLGYTFMGGTYKQRLIREIVKVLLKVAFLFNKKIIFQNSYDKEELIHLHLVDQEKCRVVDGSGVDLTEFRQESLPDQTSFLMICRLIKEKGVMEYLEAARKIREKYPDVRFRLIGPIDVNPSALTMKDLQPYIQDGSVEYLGEMADIRSSMAGASVYVLPSYYREGTPRTLLEAMAMGRPLLTTNMPGCQDTVKQGINGYLVEVRSISSLVEKMEWFIAHKEETRIMGTASFEYCKERYDVDKVNEQMLGIMNLG